MLVEISERRTINTDHIAIIQPMLWKDDEKWHVVFACGQWTIQVTSEDRKLILETMYEGLS
jgi:hypothetical protein